MAFDGRTNIVGMGDFERLISELNEDAIMTWADVELNLDASVEDFSPVVPSGRVNRMLFAVLKLFCNPLSTSFSKCSGFFHGADAWNCCSDGTVWTDADDVPPGFVVADESDGDVFGADAQDIVCVTAGLAQHEEEV